MKVTGLDSEFTVIGENTHCTRVLLRKGKRIGPDANGDEAILWTDLDGTDRTLRIPDVTLESSDFQEGRVKHVQVGVRTAMAGGDDADIAIDYLRFVVMRQVKAGVDFLDLNVDEISPDPAARKAAIEWLVQTVQTMTDVPLAIDSSTMETIDAGMSTYEAKTGRPMLNSASLERKDALDVAAKHSAHVVITSAGESSLPSDTETRVANAAQMVELALEKGIPLADMHVDLLVFPISVDSGNGAQFLDAVKQIRERFGPEIHITGGMSNVSFGIPARKLVNEVFINLAIEHGADSAILDPVASDIASIVAADRTSEPYKLASAMLLGEDMFCANFIEAFRDGKLPT